LKTRRVVRFDYWLDPAFEERLGREAGVSLSLLRREGADAAGWAALAGAHVYQVSAAKDELPRQWWVGEALLARCPQLLCVSSSGAGYDTIDAAACTRAGVAVLNQSGANARSVAEHAIGFVLALAHRMVESDRRLRRERGFAREALMGRELGGRTLGIVGIGNCGSQLAALARPFGLEVIAFDPYVDADAVRSRGAQKVQLPELLARADFVSLHCPRNAETLGLFGEAAFARMKRGAFFISTARGGIHDEAALEGALRSGHLAGAGLDVWEREPPPLEHPLLARDDVIATYHTAGVTHEARRRMAASAAEQIADILNGRRPRNLVNPEVWPVLERKL
jgi:D-3-phosphoglycerate dehydrogenase